MGAIAVQQLAVNSQAVTGEYGAKLSAAREARGWTQEQVASAYTSATGDNVTNQQVSKWERGAAIPEARRAVALLTFLGVPREDAIMAWGLAMVNRRR